MTLKLNCYEVESSENFAGYFADLVGNTIAKPMKPKKDPYSQRQRCNCIPLKVLFNIMFRALIFRRFLR